MYRRDREETVIGSVERDVWKYKRRIYRGFGSFETEGSNDDDNYR